MRSKDEKRRRRAIVRGMREKEHAEAEARMPISKVDLRDLFELLDSTLFERRGEQIWCYCDHTLRRTREFLRARGLPEEVTANWLKEYGGYCDCGVVANVSNYWAEHVGYENG
jgi:hypothetical protein